MKKIDFEIKPEDVKIPNEEFGDYYAKYLKAHPDELKRYKKNVIDQYNKTKDIGLFLVELKIIAQAERKMTAIAKKSNLKRTSLYRILSKDNNPTFNNLVALANNLGIGFSAYEIR
jgi:probable addiction module antidote protein